MAVLLTLLLLTQTSEMRYATGLCGVTFVSQPRFMLALKAYLCMGGSQKLYPNIWQRHTASKNKLDSKCTSLGGLIVWWVSVCESPLFLSLSHTLTYSRTHTHTISLSHALSLSHTLSLSCTHTHIHTHTHTHTHTQTKCSKNGYIYIYANLALTLTTR